MAFQYVGSLLSGAEPVAPPKDVVVFTEKNTGALAAGTPCEFHTDGEITFAAAQSKIAALVTTEDIDRDGTGRCMWLVPGMIFKVPVRKADGTKFSAVAGTGTHGLHASTVIGQQIRITTDGTCADGATGHHAANPLVILRIEKAGTYEADTVAWVTFAHGLLFKGAVA